MKSLGILALPSVHFYAFGGILANFPCGPSKIPILKAKLKAAVRERVDGETGLLIEKEALIQREITERSLKLPLVYMSETQPCKERPLDPSLPKSTEITDDQLKMIRSCRYFQDVPEGDFDAMINKATIRSFDPGAIIMRQGGDGNNFYIIASGEVEISSTTGYEDPLSTPVDYLGFRIKTLSVGDWFGERSLITGEPRAASIKAVKGKETTRCFTFKKEDIPQSCMLSTSTKISEEIKSIVDEKYGAEMKAKTALVYNDQMESMVQRTSQKRGSVNNPKAINGVDNNLIVAAPEEILPLLIKFKQVRIVSRCFDHILSTNPTWGDKSEQTRRNIFVSQLTASQQSEFREIFDAVDTSQDGEISVLELKQFLESIGVTHSENELRSMINKANPMVDGNACITFPEFLGIMAESEFYNLFLEVGGGSEQKLQACATTTIAVLLPLIRYHRYLYRYRYRYLYRYLYRYFSSQTFQSLDVHDSGFIKRGDLRRCLDGIERLFGDERTIIIINEGEDGEDDMLINYEAFSKMLLGT